MSFNTATLCLSLMAKCEHKHDELINTKINICFMAKSVEFQEVSFKTDKRCRIALEIANVSLCTVAKCVEESTKARKKFVNPLELHGFLQKLVIKCDLHLSQNNRHTQCA
jgi:hypothetical protein